MNKLKSYMYISFYTARRNMSNGFKHVANYLILSLKKNIIVFLILSQHFASSYACIKKAYVVC